MLAWRRVAGKRHQGLVEGAVLVGDCAEGLVCVLRQGGEIGSALCDGGDDAGAVHEEIGERPLVAVEFLEQAVGRHQRRAQVLVGLVRRRGVAGVGGGRALDDVAQRLALGPAQRVEELVEVDGAGRVDLR